MRIVIKFVEPRTGARVQSGIHAGCNFLLSATGKSKSMSIEFQCELDDQCYKKTIEREANI